MSETHQPPSANHSEGVLVAAALAGSDQAFARLVERVSSPVAAALLPDAGVAPGRRGRGAGDLPAGLAAAVDLPGPLDVPQLEAPEYGPSYTPMAGQELLKQLEAQTMLHRLPSLAEAGDLAAFLASDHATSITATGVNITNGAVAY